MEYILVEHTQPGINKAIEGNMPSAVSEVIGLQPLGSPHRFHN